MLRFDKVTCLLFLYFILSTRLTNSQWGPTVLLFLELVNMVFIFVIYLYWINYIVIFIFSKLICLIQRIYITWRISFSKYFCVLPAFTCATAIGNLWSICLGVNILSPSPFVAFIGNILLLNVLRVNSQLS